MDTLYGMSFRPCSLLGVLFVLGCSDPAGSHFINEPDGAVELSTGGVPLHGSGGKAIGNGGRRVLGSGGIIAAGGITSATGGIVGSGGANGVDTGGSISSGGARDAGGAPDAVAPDVASPDAGRDDARPDATPDDDAAPDSGSPCECSSGPCCDGCRFKPDTVLCGSEQTGTYCENPIFRMCLPLCDRPEAVTCKDTTPYFYEEWSNVFCSGSSGLCDGARIVARLDERYCPKGSYCRGSTHAGGPAPTCESSCL